MSYLTGVYLHSYLADVVFQFCHCAPNVTSGSLDVVRCRCTHVRVSEDSLNNHIWHAQPIQISS